MMKKNNKKSNTHEFSVKQNNTSNTHGIWHERNTELLKEEKKYDIRLNVERGAFNTAPFN